MSLRPQSHDIIRTWAFYTLLKSYLLFNRIPWKDIMIGTFILDEKGRGMSKSKGNAIWADELIEKYSVDVFRYWVGGASIGSDLPFNEQDLIAGKKFITKLYNASNFVFMNLKDFKNKKPVKLKPIDKYMLQKTKNMSKKAKQQYLKYSISGAKRIIEDFFWHDFCDNYLEIVKTRIYQNKKGRESAQYTLYKVLLSILKLIAPITPFITEEIYQKNYENYEKNKSIHLSLFEEISINEKSGAGDLFIKILGKIRQEKTNKKKSMKSEIVLSLNNNDYNRLNNMIEDLKDVSGAKDIKIGKFKVEFI